MTHVLDTPDLIQSLAGFAEAQSPEYHTFDSSSRDSILFLRLRAAADFFTTNKTLMQTPPPVDTEIILDPYLGNVLPTSLVPTTIYICVVAFCGWLLSGSVWKAISRSTKQRPD